MSDAPPFQLHLGDCLAGMAALADRSVDVTISDPPYDEKTHEGAWTSDDAPIGVEFAPLIDMAHVAQMLRVTSRWCLSFCSLEQLGAYAVAAAESWIRAGTWVRTNNKPQVTGDRPGQGSEGIAIFHRGGRKRWNGGGRAATWTGPRVQGDKVHPTEKPLWLMEALILDFTEPGDLVLDPYMGSGTTGVAAIRRGRRFVGFEKDPLHFATAEKRIGQAREQFGFSFAKPAKPKQAKMFK